MEVLHFQILIWNTKIGQSTQKTITFFYEILYVFVWH